MFKWLFGRKKSKPKSYHRHSKVYPYGNNGNRVCLCCGEKTHSFLSNCCGQGDGDLSWGHPGFYKVDEEKFQEWLYQIKHSGKHRHGLCEIDYGFTKDNVCCMEACPILRGKNKGWEECKYLVTDFSALDKLITPPDKEDLTLELS